MSDASLNVRLFLGSIAVAAFALGVNQAGWRHRPLIVTLFGVSGLSASSAIFYPKISVSWPNFAVSLGDIGSDAWVWFGLVVFLALYVLIWPIRVSPQARREPADSAARTQSVFTAPIAPPVSAPSAVPVAIVREKTAEKRIIVEVTPEYLIGMHVGHMHAEALRLIEPYLNKWIRLSVSVSDIRGGPGSAFSIVSSEIGGNSLQLLLMFFSGAWYDRLSVLKKEDRITVLGRIDDVEPYRVSLKECELID